MLVQLVFQELLEPAVFPAGMEMMDSLVDLDRMGCLDELAQPVQLANPVAQALAELWVIVVSLGYPEPWDQLDLQVLQVYQDRSALQGELGFPEHRDNLG